MMLWLLVGVVAVIALTAVFALVYLLRSANYDSRILEYARIDAETRRAERRLNDVTRDAFHSMLEEARR